MKNTTLLRMTLLLIVALLFSAKSDAQCDNSIIVTGSVLKSRLKMLSYQWVKCPGYASIAGAYSSTYYVVEDGEYALIGTMVGCTDTTDCVSITGLGISNTAAVEEPSIFPVPSKDGRIYISGAGLNTDASVQVRDILGNIQWESTIRFAGQQAQLNLQLPAGIYFIAIDDKASYRKQSKIIIE